jgi:VWFA-related protein
MNLGGAASRRGPGYLHTGSFAAIVLCGGVALATQQPQRTEQVNVARLIVDARVVDEAGQPILGLDAVDFDVRIDGQSVRVESAQWIGGELPESGRLPSAEIAGVVEPTDRGRLIVFVVQKSLQADRAIGLLRLLQDSERLLTRLTPEDRVAVLSFDSRLKVWLDFTDDVDRVRTILTDEVMFREPGPLAAARGPSLLSRITRDVARDTSSIEAALRLLGTALEPLPGSKSVVLIGHGFGELTVTLGIVGATLDKRYEEARAALHAARAAVFSLDVSDVDYHTFEHGLETVSYETGGLFVRTHLFARRAIDKVANALVGHYVLFTEQPAARNEEPGTHQIHVELVGHEGTVLARSTYVD